MPARPLSLGFLTVLVVVVLIVAGIGAGLLYEVNHPKFAPAPTTVAVGDNATVNYIGIFGSGPEIGKVFDTSIKSVATDNATYPKSLQYTPRNSSGYVPLAVHVGPNTPAKGYNVSGTTYIGVVTGFWKGLVGLSVNETRSATVPPDQGYGPLNQSCLRSAPLVQSIPALIVLTPTAFAKAYPKATAVTGYAFTDPTYGWTDVVQSSNRTAVAVLLKPTVGTTTNPYGWTMLVVNVSSSAVTLQSQLTPASVGSVAGSIANVTVCGTTKFLVWKVDLANGSYTQNYNREVVGQTLIFIVTVVTILKPS